MGTTFSRSVAAQAAAMTVIETAKKDGLLSGPVATAPELAESEKELFLEMFRKLAERQGTAAKSLTSDEISSLFTFVYARAAEAKGVPEEVLQRAILDNYKRIFTGGEYEGPGRTKGDK